MARRSVEVASTGTATDEDSTWTEEACAVMAAGRRCCGAGHVARAKLPKQASLTEAYGMTSGGREDGASELRPSFRMCLSGHKFLWPRNALTRGIKRDLPADVYPPLEL